MHARVAVMDLADDKLGSPGNFDSKDLVLAYRLLTEAADRSAVRDKRLLLVLKDSDAVYDGFRSLVGHVRDESGLRDVQSRPRELRRLKRELLAEAADTGHTDADASDRRDRRLLSIVVDTIDAIADATTTSSSSSSPPVSATPGRMQTTNTDGASDTAGNLQIKKRKKKKIVDDASSSSSSRAAHALHPSLNRKIQRLFAAIARHNATGRALEKQAAELDEELCKYTEGDED